MLINKKLKNFENIYERKQGIPDAYKIDEIDLDAYYFLQIHVNFHKVQRNNPSC